MPGSGCRGVLRDPSGPSPCPAIEAIPQVDQVLSMPDSIKASRTVRLVSLILVPLYLFYVSHVLCLVTEAPLWLCVCCVALAATVIMGVLTVFGVKALENHRQGSRFSIATLMLVVVPLSIYLTAARYLLGGVLNDPKVPLVAWVVLIGFALFVCGFTTVVLLYFAEALMWVGLLGLQLVRRLAARTTRKP